ncbi:MAG: hypothetical protein RR967_02775 [Anaerovoracaceae bacterium]
MSRNVSFKETGIWENIDVLIEFKPTLWVKTAMSIFCPGTGGRFLTVNYFNIIFRKGSEGVGKR